MQSLLKLYVLDRSYAMAKLFNERVLNYEGGQSILLKGIYQFYITTSDRAGRYLLLVAVEFALAGLIKNETIYVAKLPILPADRSEATYSGYIANIRMSSAT